MFKYNAHGDGITREKLLADVRYGGVRPTCKCGCGSYTDISKEDKNKIINELREKIL